MVPLLEVAGLEKPASKAGLQHAMNDVLSGCSSTTGRHNDTVSRLQGEDWKGGSTCLGQG